MLRKKIMNKKTEIDTEKDGHRQTDRETGRTREIQVENEKKKGENKLRERERERYYESIKQKGRQRERVKQSGTDQKKWGVNRKWEKEIERE